MKTLFTKMKTKILIITIISLFLGSALFAQENKSILVEQSEYYESLSISGEANWDKYQNYTTSNAVNSAKDCELNKRVFGWHPYWMGSAYNSYNFNMLSDIAYFSYSVNPNTGSYNDIHEWRTTPLIDLAKQNGVKVSLAVTMFSGHATFFGSAASKQRLIDSLISLVEFREADGVNIDFEAVPSSQSENLTAFMIDLSNQFHAAFPQGEVSMAVPAVDWSGTFDVLGMAQYVDLFIIMGYDYHWSSAPNAGPVSPKNNGDLWSAYDVTRSVIYYLNEGIPKEKLCLGVAYYGYEWATSSGNLNATTTGSGTARTYNTAVNYAQTYGREWDENSSTPYYMYQSGNQWYQCWYDDEVSLSYKYDMIKAHDIAGIGIWALGYDNGLSTLWDLIEEKFSSCGNLQTEGFFSDMGGPKGNYFNNEEYQFTISPVGADSITLVFNEFDVELNYDTLFIYDGLSTNSPLLAELTGELIVSPIIAHSGSVTFRFFSDGATVGEGWNIAWSSNGFPPTENQEISEIRNISVFPNPFSDVLQLQFTELTESEAIIQIYSLNGNLVGSQTANCNKGENSIDLSSIVSQIPQGFYFLKITFQGKNFSTKTIKLCKISND